MPQETQILLINPPNPDPVPDYFGPPYGLSLIAATLRAKGLKVKGLDLDNLTTEQGVASAVMTARKCGAKIIGITTQSAARDSIYRMSKKLKCSLPGVKVVLGGAFATALPETILRNSGADIAVIGDGEETFQELALSFLKNAPVAGIPGTATLKNGLFSCASPRAQIENIDTIPYPYFEAFDFKKRIAPALITSRDLLGFDPEVNFIPGKRCCTLRASLMLLSSRGCIYSCVFCPMSGEKGFKIRFHTPEYFVDMAENFHRRHGIRDFVFGDNFFTCDRARTMRICQEITRRNLKIRWMCMTRCDATDPILLKAMARAGCAEISYGVESFSEKVQKTTGKRLDLALVEPCLNNTRAAGIHGVLMLMSGNPGESEATMRTTLSACRRLNPGKAVIKMTRVYPGTALHNSAVRAGIIPKGYYTQAGHEAPYYTAELPIKEFTRLSELVRERTVYIDLPGRLSKKDLSLRQIFLLAYHRTERLSLGTQKNDILLSPFLSKTLRILEDLQLANLELRTDASALLDPAILRKITGRKLFIRLHLEFSDAARTGNDHLQGQGRFAASLAGAAIWRRNGGEFSAKVRITQEACAELPVFCARLAKLGCSAIEFSLTPWLPRSAGLPRQALPMPAWRDIQHHLKSAAALCAQKKISVSVTGVPECLLSGLPEVRPENRSPFDERILFDGSSVALSLERETLFKLKSPRCRGCRWQGHCEGLWINYAEDHGTDELQIQ